MSENGIPASAVSGAPAGAAPPGGSDGGPGRSGGAQGAQGGPGGSGGSNDAASGSDDVLAGSGGASSGSDGAQDGAPGAVAGLPHAEEHGGEGLASRLNWLRAGVLGANDGIVSVAAVVVGVAGATAEPGPILVAGAAAVLGGAISMALGEYVSVSSQRDAQHALVAKERAELEAMPEEELEELTVLYEQKGLSRATAERVAAELTERDALRAHLETELHIDEDDIPSPWAAAVASALAFLIGAALPFLLAVLLPPELRIPFTFVGVLVALALTGAVGAYLGGAKGTRAAIRTIVGGALALAVTWGIGSWLGTGVV